MRTYKYLKLTDDIVESADQSFSLSDNYQIFPTTKIGKIWNVVARHLASAFGWFYSRIILHVRVIGKEKLQAVNGGYFVYANHTQPIGDAFIPLTIYPVMKFYAIAGQANWGIPFIGKYLLPYGGLPVGNDIKQAAKLLQAIKTVIRDKKGVVVIYPESHVWPYYTKIRPFPTTSMHFPIQLNAPSFTATSTYQHSKFFKRPKMTIYIDGPFYSDQGLSKKEAQAQLHDEIWKSLSNRAKLSNYSYYNYEEIKQ